MVLEIVYSWLIGLLGVSFYVFKSIHSKLTGNNKFDIKKLINENQMFWLVSVTLNLIITIILKVTPQAAEIVGYAVNLETNFGFLIIGYTLAGGTNVSPIGKKVQEKKQSIYN
tara:strand:+ start:3128 stop:3466 length:339 start_codon:yes stop_codon:yes gene_type:complete